MAVSTAYLEMLEDLLAPIGKISVRRMFGGAGIYCDSIIFGLVADDVLHLKVDEASRAAFEAEGCGPFQYETGTGTVHSLASYHRAPDRLLDEPDDLRHWVRRAIAISQRAAAAEVKVTRRPPHTSRPPRRRTPT